MKKYYLKKDIKKCNKAFLFAPRKETPGKEKEKSIWLRQMKIMRNGRP